MLYLHWRCSSACLSFFQSPSVGAVETLRSWDRRGAMWVVLRCRTSIAFVRIPLPMKSLSPESRLGRILGRSLDTVYYCSRRPRSTIFCVPIQDDIKRTCLASKRLCALHRLQVPQGDGNVRIADKLTGRVPLYTRLTISRRHLSTRCVASGFHATCTCQAPLSGATNSLFSESADGEIAYVLERCSKSRVNIADNLIAP